MFECSLVSGDPDAVCVHVAGELDIATAPELKRALRNALLIARLVVLDLRDVQFIDSAGVHAIVNASTGARVLARRVVLLGGPAHVDRLFTLSGTEERLEYARADSLGSVCTEASRRRRAGLMPGPWRDTPALRQRSSYATQKTSDMHADATITLANAPAGAP